MIRKGSRIVVVGDAYVSPITLQEAALTLPVSDPEVVCLMWGTGDKDEFSQMQTQLERNGPDAVPCPPELEKEIETADILMVHFCPVSSALIARAKNLKLVGVCRGGYENIASEALTERGIPLIHVIRNAEAVAEFTLGMMFAETRNIARSHHLIQNGQWPVEFPNTEYCSTLRNLVVGIVGLGNIGALLAQKLHALGVKVLGYDAYLSRDLIEKMPVEYVDSLEEIFKKSDVLSIHLRLTEENRGMIGAEMLSYMKPTAYLINAARAGLIDDAALVDALRNRKIAGAALDVFEEEPLRADHPFCTLDNVTLTPHIAGDTVDAISRSPFPLAKAIEEYLLTGSKKNLCNII